MASQYAKTDPCLCPLTTSFKLPTAEYGRGVKPVWENIHWPKTLKHSSIELVVCSVSVEKKSAPKSCFFCCTSVKVFYEVVGGAFLIDALLELDYRCQWADLFACSRTKASVSKSLYYSSLNHYRVMAVSLVDFFVLFWRVGEQIDKQNCVWMFWWWLTVLVKLVSPSR